MNMGHLLENSFQVEAIHSYKTIEPYLVNLEEADLKRKEVC